MVSGSICAEVQVDAPASAAWEIYGTLKLPGYSEQALPNIVEKIELVHGDGSAGTLLQLFFLPGKILIFQLCWYSNLIMISNRTYIS